MNSQNFDSHMPNNYEEEIRQRLYQAILLPSCADDESQDEEDEEIQIALARSRADNEIEVAQAASGALQEEEDLKKAIAESQTSFQEEREIRNLLTLSEQVNFEAMVTRQTMLTPSIEVQEQMFEWLQDTPDAADDTIFFINDYEGEELAALYKNYRLVPTLFSEEEMWPPSAIQQQLRELHVNRGMEDVREWQNTQSEDDRCLVCLTNVATRIAVPCGHRLSCRTCLSSLVRQDNYYSVTAADGQTVLTDRPIPILCCTCRAIVGQIVTIH